MNRYIVVIAVALLMAAAVIRAVVSAPPSVASDLDPRLASYPELVIRLTEERIEAPASLPAGPTLLIEENVAEGAGHAFILRIPDDVEEATVEETLGGGSIIAETPEWFWRSTFVGNGDRAAIDRPALGLVELEPGRYIAGDPFRSPAEFARFEVTPPIVADSAETGELQADVVAELFEMGFTLPETMPAGPQLWEVTNAGAMLHEIALFPVPAGATPQQVETAMTAELQVEFGGDPAEGRATIDDLGPSWVGWSSNLVAGVGVLSPQRTSWAQIDLPPGTYGAVCFIPEPTSGQAHLMMGMTEVFTVEAPTA